MLRKYLFSARLDLTRNDFNELVKKFETTYPKGSKTVMTLAQAYREEGKEEGIIKVMERAWEAGKNIPNGPAKRMLSMLKQDPKIPEKYQFIKR